MCSIFRRCCTILFGGFLQGGLVNYFTPTSEVVTKMVEILRNLVNTSDKIAKEKFLINIQTDKHDKKLEKLLKTRLTEIPRSSAVRSDVDLILK